MDTIKIFLTATDKELAELRTHLSRNGYNVSWKTDRVTKKEEILLVNEEEFHYVLTIIQDRKLEYFIY